MFQLALCTVNTPSSKRSRVDALIPNARGVSGAGEAAGAAVDAQFQSEIVYVVGNTFYSIWEFDGVGHNLHGHIIST